MRYKWLKKIVRGAVKPISIFVVPHSGLPSLRLNLPAALLLALGVSWTALTVWAGYIAGRQFDYYVTRTDNKILRAKMEYVSQQVEKGLAYLEMTRKTDRQLRKMLGMSPNLADDNDSIGGPTASDLSDFRKLLSSKASEIRETSLNNSIFKMQEESHRRLSSYAEVTWYITNRHNSAKATPSSWPVVGRITSYFGYRIAPLRIASEYHSGVDIANEPGTPVYATADGVVRYSGWANGYGLSVVLDHGFAYSTLYGHFSELVVKEGAQVRRGQLIGRVGSTGTSTGPHLHYEVWVDGIPRDPVKYLQEGGKRSPLAGIFESIFS
ncbi:MAG: M23 family metallopeptidase [Elusimicrobiales bacterium]|jgi:murein DD-endopeptidase MepM/ murein hydrolase activator NlpD